ncbi:CubicO group peptidase, beta-lactamase class C family [Algoriphagus faecimaris]|uniref:CubicO group peptidase, beta-lactamase class C family n=1 Tax=Algoriphagus faecimaris TaxID=686796 RepID=A0A1G6N9U4_9BACT|nr:serine hydrolase domain-containing protein [Algoriphagus faecimaris]SDC64640.1 CubicO group peptidase, beta-lactamase class C family [Algoriphagus faecimaris]
MKQLAFIFTFYISTIGVSLAQLSPEKETLLDSIFQEWNQPGMPGGSIGVMQDGRIIYSKAFGLASLDFGVPNMPNTLFNIASVSKQFTAMAIVRMAEKGLLSLDDDVRKYLPEIPDFGQTITFKHLIHHTSGLRSVHYMLGLAGWRGDDVRTNEDVFRFVTMQKDLNYPVGERYGYCNTGYVLMALVVERLSGKSFAEWMKSEVFEPLSLEHTYVEDNYTRVVPNNASSYYHSEGVVFERALDYWNYTGAGNIHSTTEDLLLWAKNLYSPKPGWENAFEKMKDVGIYSNGQPSNYAFGLYVDEYGSQKRIHHSGSIGGFRAQIATFPDLNLSISILSNFSSSNLGQKLNGVSEIILDNDGTSNSQSELPQQVMQDVDPNLAILIKGSYWDTYEKRVFQIEKKGQKLFVVAESSERLLQHLGDGEFSIKDADGRKLKFDIQNEEVSSAKSISKEGIENVWIPLGENSFSASELKDFEGEYYSGELQTSYWFKIEGDHLVAYHPRHGEIPLERLTSNAFKGRWPALIVEFVLNPDGKSAEVMLSNDRVKNLKLSRPS